MNGAWALVGENSDDLEPVWGEMEISSPDLFEISGTSITVIEYTLN